MQMFAWKHGGTGNDPKRKQHKEHSLVEWLKRVYILIYIYIFGIYSHSDISFVVMHIHFLECSMFFQWLWPTWNALLKRGLPQKVTATQWLFSSVFQFTAAQKERQHVCVKWRVTPNIKSWLVCFSFFCFLLQEAHFAWSSEGSAGQQLMSQQWRRARLQHFPG